MRVRAEDRGISYAENQLKYRVPSRREFLRIAQAARTPHDLLEGYEPVEPFAPLVGQIRLNRYYDTAGRDLFRGNHSYRFRVAEDAEGRLQTSLQFKECVRQEGAWLVRQELECLLTGWERPETAFRECKPYILGECPSFCHTALAETLGVQSPVAIEPTLTTWTDKTGIILRRTQEPFVGVDAFGVSFDQVAAIGPTGDTHFLEMEVGVMPADTPQRRQSGYLSAVLRDLCRLEARLGPGGFGLEPSPRPKYQVALEALIA